MKKKLRRFRTAYTEARRKDASVYRAARYAFRLARSVGSWA